MLVLLIIAFGAISSLLLLLYATIMGEEVFQSVHHQRILILIQNSCLFLFPPLVAAHLFQDAPIGNTLQLRQPPFLLLLLGCLALIASTPLVELLHSWNQALTLPDALHPLEQWMRVHEQQATTLSNRLLEASTLSDLLMNLLVIAILAGVGEELLFRGILQKTLIKWTGNIHWGILISSVIFSAIHLQFFGFLPRLVLGVLLGYLYVWGKNLWIPILAHTFNNAAVVCSNARFLWGKEGDANNLFTNDDTPGIWMLSASIVLLAAILYYFRWYYKRASRNSGICG